MLESEDFDMYCGYPIPNLIIWPNEDFFLLQVNFVHDLNKSSYIIALY